MAHAKILFTVILGFVLLSGTAYGQTDPEDIPDELTITLEEAIQIALLNNYMLRQGVLDIEMVDEQIREAWGSVYPQVNASGSYNRNIISPNPFAGSDAGGLFNLIGSLEWLAFNENARFDDDTDPISLEEFMERQQEGMEAAGISRAADDNPFAVDNQFELGLSVTQTLYNGAAFAAIKGVRQMREVNQDQFQREQQTVVDQVRNAFYTALLSQEQTQVLRSSIERLQRTVEETEASVEAGVLSRFDLLSAEVELVNLETDLIEAENQSELSIRNLSLQLGIPVKTRVHLRGALEFDDQQMADIPGVEDAYRRALEQRPDMSRAEGFLDLLEVNNRIVRSRYRPTVNAFANVGYMGQVPDNRQVISQTPGDQFGFTSSQRRFFSNSYWDPAVSVGIQLQWSLFNGFQTRSQIQQSKIEMRQAEIDRELLENNIYLEVEQALNDLETAHKRITSQQRNIEQAEVNYENSLRRLAEGVGTTLEERQASSLLDQSRLNYLSAVYDFLTAMSRFQQVTGEPVNEHYQYPN
ncbi:MAG: TolC family protein [Balneolaceae bacterium]